MAEQHPMAASQYARVADNTVPLDNRGRVRVWDVETGRPYLTVPVSANEAIAAGTATLSEAKVKNIMILRHPQRGDVRVDRHNTKAIAEYERRGYRSVEKIAKQAADKGSGKGADRFHRLVGLSDPRGTALTIAEWLSRDEDQFDADVFAHILSGYTHAKTKGEMPETLADVRPDDRDALLRDMRISYGLDPNTGEPLPDSVTGEDV